MFGSQQSRCSFTSYSYLVCITLLVATLFGCSAGGTSPSVAEIDKGVRSDLARYSKFFSVVSFNKTDGLLMQDGAYVADYKVDVKFAACGFFNAEGKYMELDNWDCDAKPGEIYKSALGGTAYGVGYVLSIPGKAEYVKKESGWRLRDNQLTFPQ